MPGPRFALVTGGPRSGSGLVVWPHSLMSAVPDGAGVWFAWRLLGGNNRELGRSAAVDVSRGEVLAWARHVRDTAAALTATVSMDAARGQWGWRLADDDETVHAVSSRLYLRQRECQYSLRQFLEAVGTAGLWDVPQDRPSPPGEPHTVIDLTGPQPRVVVSPPAPSGPDRPVVLRPRSAPPIPGTSTRVREQEDLVRRRATALRASASAPWPS